MPESPPLPLPLANARLAYFGAPGAGWPGTRRLSDPVPGMADTARPSSAPGSTSPAWLAPVRRLGWVSFLTDVASEMIYPLLPGFLTRTLGAGPAVLGLIEGVAETTSSLVKMASGTLSDRLRRRKPLVVAGYLLAALARPLVALAGSWPQVLAVRFTDRVGKGIRSPPRDALLAGLAPPEQRGRAFGIQRAMDHAGALIGPLLAAGLLHAFAIGERTLFALAAIPGLAGVALLVWRVPEVPATAQPVREATTATATARSSRLPREVRLAIALFALFTLSNSSDAFLILRAREAGVAAADIPLLWAFHHLIKSALGSRGGALSDRIGRSATIGLGWGVYALSYLGFAFASSPGAAWLLFAVYGLHYALVEGAERALLADLAPPDLRGCAFGAFHASLGLVALPASLWFGLAWQALGSRGAFLLGAAIAAIAATALLAATRLRWLAPAEGSR